jgi:lipoprotein-releasing system ATP-binding protein
MSLKITHMLELKDITRVFKTDDDRTRLMVLNNLSLSVNSGESIAIVGRSGSGKTTLLNILGLLDTPDTGEVWLNNQSANNLSQNQLARLRATQLGFVFQLHHLLPQCTLFENVMLPILATKIHGAASVQRAERLIKAVGLWEMRHQKPNTLSGGECQRTAVLRSVINSPKLLLADEPTGALDEQSANEVMDLLLTISRDESMSLIVVTHSDEVAQRMDKIYRLKNGTLTREK